jgi:hypothetical protein
MASDNKQRPTDAGGKFANATIGYEASVRGPKETGINLFTFEVAYRIENGNNFHVVISNFGLPGREWAGSKAPIVQMRFSSEEAESAKRRLIEFFSGQEDKPYMPFNLPQANFLGADFAKNWINDE